MNDKTASPTVREKRPYSSGTGVKFSDDYLEELEIDEATLTRTTPLPSAAPSAWVTLKNNLELIHSILFHVTIFYQLVLCQYDYPLIPCSLSPTPPSLHAEIFIWSAYDQFNEGEPNNILYISHSDPLTEVTAWVRLHYRRHYPLMLCGLSGLAAVPLPSDRWCLARNGPHASVPNTRYLTSQI